MEDVTQRPSDMSDDRDKWSDEPIGKGQASIRVLNFSGGGFDSVMQLGVAHALLVSQGKAPDVVVGVSSGAIGAAGIAEILQAGELPAYNISSEHYEAALGDRVVKFRQFVDASHSAPEKILDAIFPDAYQIDSFEPLVSLQLPRLPPEERKERDDWIKRKTGLVRLYNDLLSIDLPFGTITRLIRRSLGFSASNALRNPLKRLVVKSIEVAKSWLVIGSQLYKLAPLLALGGRTLSGGQSAVGPTSAGSIIFKFRPTEQFARLWRKYLSFSFLLINWVVISWAILFLPILLAHVLTSPPALTRFSENPLSWSVYAHGVLYLIPFVFRFAKVFRVISLLVTWSFVSFPILLLDLIYRDVPDTRFTFFYVFYFLYLVPFILPVTPAARAFEGSKLSAAIRDLSKGLFALIYYVCKWTVVLIPIAALLVILGTVIGAFLILAVYVVVYLATVANSSWTPSGGTANKVLLAGLFAALAFLTVIGRPVFHFVRAFFSFRRIKKSKISPLSWTFRNFLDFYGLGPALAHNYRLKQFLIELFDPNYYGQSQMSSVLDQSLIDKEPDNKRKWGIANKRVINEYKTAGRKHGAEIILAVAATDVESGGLSVLPPSTPIIDGLLAATAKTPLFEPIDIGDRLFIDGIEIGNAPTRALVNLFEESGLADNTAVHIYPVDPLPISQEGGLGPYAPVKGQPFLNLIDIVLRALQLQHFRDAWLERFLTRAINNVIPAGQSTISIVQNGSERQFFRAFFAPIELERAPYLNREMFYRSRTERWVVMAETIADGCRASLEVMLAGTLTKIRTARRGWKDERANGFVACSDAVLQARKDRKLGSIEFKDIKLPGCGANGPGLAEICKHCKLRSLDDGDDEPIATQSLRLKGKSVADPEVPDWPHEFDSTIESSLSPVVVQKKGESKRNALDGDATIACLFSGGVFRGVFQMGVLNALGLVNVRPKVIAGASVGSITAAMVAKALSETDDDLKRSKILELSSIYLGIDRFILTDRFADYIRNWTIRASEARFSLRQLDEVFRKYDAAKANLFQRTFREVLAGLERLFYINPYQINELVKAVRNRRGKDAGELLKSRLQQWLDRMDVGQEVLGAEPIRILIEEFVIPDEWTDRPHIAPFGSISDDMIFLATTTNLTQGDLKLLSSRDPVEAVTLIEGLLASSAFPGVFRPRRSWDLFPGTSKEDQYIDGGVMDNLPLSSVLTAMRELAKNKVIPLRPESAPHLMLAASLEVDHQKAHEIDIEVLRNYWPELSARARELKYNTKLDTFSRVAQNIQDIYAGVRGDYDPLKVNVLAIKPKWLCNTFAFHPMLGFRRSLQAASIAHGCAATLLAFGNVKEAADGWNLRTEAIPDVGTLDTALDRLDEKKRKDIRAGRCWLNGTECPYSKVALKRSSIPEDNENTKYWLRQIHRRCWERGTHERRH